MHTEKLEVWRACSSRLQAAHKKLLEAVNTLDDAGIDKYGAEVALHNTQCATALQALYDALEADKQRQS